MVNQALITKHVRFGYGKSASKVGVECGHYRPTSASDPLASGWPLTPIFAAFDTDFNFSFVKPSNYVGDPVYAGLFDTTNTIVGDYIVEPQMGTFFIASQETFKAAMCISCNRVLTFTRPAAGPSGASYYGGDVTATETPLLTRWPASVRNGTKGEASFVNLPGDVRQPWVQILVPSVGGVQLRSGDVVVDEQGITQRYILSATELTSFGYRLTATIVNT